uniref:Prune exopolyphosphatase 1 n=1 Tax=Varanus komodoensis TaxID=61221 RepID=A0A8D2IT49_VARKO
DLDSMVSAMAFAYFLAASKAAFIPVLNIPRLDFPLRTESTFFLKQQHLPESFLVFRDEIDLVALHQAGLLSLTLVDHHVLPSRDAVLEEAVLEVMDHRPLERERSPPCRVTAEPVGSCATLVAERFLQGPPETLDGLTAALLHGAIVLDCVNMAPAAGKVTPKDARCVSLLESKFPSLAPRNVLFEALQKAKFDVSGLTTEQMLRKDLKALSGTGTAIALSAVYLDLQTFLRRPGLEQELSSFCQERSFDALLAMAISFGEGGEPFRQLAVYSQAAELRAAVCRTLERSCDPHLRLSPLESPFAALCAYDQGNAAASRKKVLPVVKDFLREWDRRDPACAAMQPEAAGQSHEPRLQPGGAVSGGPEREATPKDPAKPSPHPGDDLADDDAPLPPTPMNSLVDECPLDRGLPKLSVEAVFEKFNRITAAPSCTDGSPEKK